MYTYYHQVAIILIFWYHHAMLELQDADDCIQQGKTGLLQAVEYNQILKSWETNFMIYWLPDAPILTPLALGKEVASKTICCCWFFFDP